ncbi:unnamed protein product [Moneuplotes crassus]|uniref:Myb-like DNA-binding domain containing protein n=1 Tax=Euplotes crassus TaxID=5936 RepID=A0AAD1Y924_EUPCR|nr:unnamed protein product [Moneuplotes crassus]
METPKCTWNEEDDKTLLELAQMFNFHWVKVAENFPGRNRQQCYDRWRHIDPSYDKGPWTEPEDGQIIDWMFSLVNQQIHHVLDKLVSRRRYEILKRVNRYKKTLLETLHPKKVKVKTKPKARPRRSARNSKKRVVKHEIKQDEEHTQSFSQPTDPDSAEERGKIDPDQKINEDGWTIRETNQLFEVVLRCGKKWKTCAKILPSKNPIQCKNHFTTVLKSALNVLRSSLLTNSSKLGINLAQDEIDKLLEIDIDTCDSSDFDFFIPVAQHFLNNVPLETLEIALPEEPIKAEPEDTPKAQGSQNFKWKQLNRSPSNSDSESTDQDAIEIIEKKAKLLVN